MRFGIGAAVLLWAAVSNSGTLHAQSPADWPMFGHDPGSTRFSPLDQINTQTVSTLTRAWTYHMKRDSPAATSAGAIGHGGGRRSSQATPIVIDGTMYLPTPYGTVVALDPETGTELWTFKMDKSNPAGRGVSYWPGDAQAPASIVFGTRDARLIALNAKTGKLMETFGNHGIVDLKVGVDNGFHDARYDMTSPPEIYKDLIITGSQVQETPSRGTSGDVRAWDVHTGKLVWQFHSVPHPGETGNDTWPADGWQNRSGTNVWGMISVDLKRGLVFLPFGSPSFDFYGKDRKGKNLFGNSLVALDAQTGKLAWYFQTVHHDITDFDLESAPVLMDVRHKGKDIPAVAVIGKAGLMYILDRRNGKPIYGVEERPVPASDVPGEVSWPTQPFPLKPVPLGRNSFNASEIATVTPEHQKFCETMYAKEGGRNRGPFTPFGMEMTIMFPGTIGVTNWQGMSLNPKLGYLFVNTTDLADIGKVQALPAGSDPQYERASPWGTYAHFWDNDKFWPCQQPPWGQLWAINVNTGEVAWKIPFGVVPELEAKGVHGTGTPNYGGSIATAGGLVFIAATNDQHFRAFEAGTGKVLWDTKLETGSYNVPMTFQGKSGKQYVALVATGGSYYDATSGDSLIAFALPTGSSAAH
ncbi:pyrroloquinoline quinone-dependent dehydrogenase [Granulicella sp. WH15]|uniref:pyrroloquinoline quinone-dependent dehydrogenase n=1 Tax=Granulicella sp. WH15 TaxID=2602070 RepID=UPI001366CFCE|nr:pyrroloquinoline quinone-dependent dehydrogenase [Granulicella sp. WH15]QHN03963.1 pyrroloquinoline quinone-dependent dehydrogenase [Granulicella sp. WH15]